MRRIYIKDKDELIELLEKLILIVSTIVFNGYFLKFVISRERENFNWIFLIVLVFHFYNSLSFIVHLGEDVIKTLVKMVKDQSSNQEEE